MPAIYISKYNRFVDNVIGRISRILGKNYDPVKVKLLSPNQRSKVKAAGKQNAKIKKNNSAKVNPQKKTIEPTNKMGEFDIARADGGNSNKSRTIESESREPAFILISKTGPTSDDFLKNITVTSTEIKPSNNTIQLRQANKKKKNTIKTGGNASNKNKTKQSNNKNKQKAKATLFGLSTIKRDGNVIVNMMADHTMVKTNFVLGPLTLRVEREVANKGRRELKSATATTAEMYGRMNLKIIHGGAATLHSLRVLQPKQVRIDSDDNHDKTREFLWKRSAHIASVVSQKLSTAARSMLRPPHSM